MIYLIFVASLINHIKFLMKIVNQCPICLYKIRPNDIRILRCKHAHHRGCLEEWLFSKNSRFLLYLTRKILKITAVLFVKCAYQLQKKN